MNKKEYFKIADQLDNQKACRRSDLETFCNDNLPNDIKAGDAGAAMWDAGALAIMADNKQTKYFKNGDSTTPLIPVITDKQTIISHIWNEILANDGASVTASSDIDNWADDHTAYPIARAIESHFDDEKFSAEDQLAVIKNGKRATRMDVLNVCKKAMGINSPANVK